MNRTELTDQLEKLLFFFNDPPEGSEEIYYTHLKDIKVETFEKAIDILIDTHEQKRFPLIAEFNKAIRVAEEELSPSVNSSSSSDCAYCRGIGVVLVEVDPKRQAVAKPCTCARGETYQRSFNKAHGSKDKELSRFIADMEESRKRAREEESLKDPY